ncbi:hypothetical protein [Streptomyces sp. NRRL S-244]|nr:hypothetical protein [Streptomyces sp. NRRL S-244]
MAPGRERAGDPALSELPARLERYALALPTPSALPAWAAPLLERAAG